MKAKAGRNHWLVPDNQPRPEKPSHSNHRQYERLQINLQKCPPSVPPPTLLYCNFNENGRTSRTLEASVQELESYDEYKTIEGFIFAKAFTAGI